MARYFKTILSFALLLFASCQEGGEAGDLLGQWRLADSDTKYVSFSGSLTLFRSITEGEVYGKFQHEGDSLFIQCLSIHGYPRDTAIVENSFGFQPFGDIRLKIETLSNDKIVLSKGQKQWRFRKY
ncbi:MAG: lipocalin-like domain-containing protein [Prevotella sp.]|nr:lipocalin-like domain-containing protein [Prevotella sp.]